MTAAIDALEEGFRSSLPATPQRVRLAVGSGDLLLMPAGDERGAGVKLVTVNPENKDRGRPVVQAIYVLFAEGTLEPVAILDGAALTALRTAAVSALATRLLARNEAEHLVVFGAGVQAHGHLEAMTAVRRIQRVTVVSRTAPRAEMLVAAARKLGLDAALGDSRDVEHADILCTCTTSTEPLFDGRALRPGTHVNAIGAYSPDTRELDDETMRRARVVVETREAALAEAGDILIPMQRGVIARDSIVADLSELVAVEGFRRAKDDVTVFKSVGLAFEDLLVARAALARQPRP